MTENSKTQNELGSIEIFDEVVKKIAGQAAIDVDGVYDLRVGVGEFVKQATTGRRDFSKGVEVKRESEDAPLDLDLYVIIEFNVKVGEVAHNAQIAVKEKVEAITGQKVKSVNIHVADIRQPEEPVKELRP